MGGWLDQDRPGSGAVDGDGRQIDGVLHIWRDASRSWEPVKVGDRLPMPPRKLDVRPSFDGQSKSSFKPARNGKR